MMDGQVGEPSMIWMLHAGRAILVASALTFIAALVAEHPPFLTYGAVRTEAAAIAVSKHAFGRHDAYLARDDHPWRGWLDCERPFAQCQWISGYWQCPLVEFLVADECEIQVWTVIDERSGKVRELRSYGGQ
jgi:hypothetical protein